MGKGPQMESRITASGGWEGKMGEGLNKKEKGLVGLDNNSVVIAWGKGA